MDVLLDAGATVALMMVLDWIIVSAIQAAARDAARRDIVAQHIRIES